MITDPRTLRAVAHLARSRVDHAEIPLADEVIGRRAAEVAMLQLATDLEATAGFLERRTAGVTI